MFNIKLEDSNDIINFLKLSVIGLKVTIKYTYDFREITGKILKNDEDWITILIPNDTFTITKESINSLELKQSDYYSIINSKNRKFELGDIVEIINVNGLNRVLYNEFPRGNKDLIGLQGKIIMIDDKTDKNITYYLLNLPQIKNHHVYIGNECIVNGRCIFLVENLKLIKKENDVRMNNKQEYIKELEEIKNQQKELADKMELLQKKIEGENIKKRWWTPKVQDTYYWISGEVIIEKSINHEYNSDKRIINNLNYYKTREQAEREAFEQLLQRKLNKFAFENNEHDINWNDNQQLKYRIYYSKDRNELVAYAVSNFKDFGQVYFSSVEVAEKAIEEFKNDLLRYFTSDK